MVKRFLRRLPGVEHTGGVLLHLPRVFYLHSVRSV